MDTFSQTMLAGHDRVAVPVVEVSGPGTGPARISITGASAVIGRSADCEIRLDNPLVSRAHARLDRGPDGRWRVRDLGSHNGTRLNNQPAAELVVTDGDRIQIGPFVLRLELPQFPPVLGSDPADRVRRLGLSDDVRIIRTLQEVEPPKLAVDQLRCLDEYSRLALDTASATDRLAALCRLMLNPTLGGRWAVAVAAENDNSDPRTLTPMQISPGATTAPRLSRSLIRAAVQRRMPVLATHSPIGSPQADQDVQLSISPEISPMAAVAVPLTTSTSDAPAGRIELLCAGFPPEYGTGEWLALCALAAHHYRQAETVWANIASRQKLAAMEADLERARRVQDRLVPKQTVLPGLDVAVRFSPCHGVAGDYVDALPLPGGCSLLVVADVCGKGLPAALVAMGLHTIVHASARRWAGLADLAAAVDAHLADTLAPDSFVTFIAMTIDPATGALEVVNGGHPAAAAIDPAGAMRRVGLENDFPLGLMPQTLTVTTDRLDAGQTLLLFTDGCYELFDASDQMLGPDEFCQLAAAPIAHAADTAAAADEISRLLDGWQGSAAPSDDRTLLLVRRR